MEIKIGTDTFIFKSIFWQLNSGIYHLGHTTLISDPAYTETEIERIKSKCKNWPNSKLLILYTHGDYDHIVGDCYFDATVRIASKSMQVRPHQNKIINQILNIDQEFYLERSRLIHYPPIDHVIEWESNEAIVKKFGDLSLYFYPAPGHTADGMYTVIEPLGIWIAGDYLSDIEFPFVEDSVAKYIETMRLSEKILKAHRIQCMIPGHGNHTDSVVEIKFRIDQSVNYLNELIKSPEKDWRETWGHSSFGNFLDKMHAQNIMQINKDLKRK